MDWEELKKACAGRVVLGAPAAPFTSYHLGGPVAALVAPRDRDDLAALMAFLHSGGGKYLPLGGGSNVLFSDAGFEGAVVHLSRDFRGVEAEGDLLRVQAGTPLPAFLRKALEAGLGGLEFLAGIPGDVGGAVAGNAGSRGDWIGSRVVEMTVVTPEGRVEKRRPHGVRFGYRHSSLQETGDLVVEVVVRADRMPPEEAEKRVSDYLRDRMAKQPHSQRSAGSVFKNPEGLSAGRLVDEAGLKGFRVGGASISEVHANFIVSDGGTAADVAAVMREAQKRVLERKSLRLEPEILPMGDWDWESVKDIWWNREKPYFFK